MVAHTVDMEQQKADDKEKRMKTVDKEIYTQMLDAAVAARHVRVSVLAGGMDRQTADSITNAIGKEAKMLQLYLMKEMFIDMVTHRVVPPLVLLETVAPPSELVA